jgi:hypothetical protein
MRKMERVMGIEPTLSAWEAEVLPLNYTRRGDLNFKRLGRSDQLFRRWKRAASSSVPETKKADANASAFLLNQPAFTAN